MGISTGWGLRGRMDLIHMWEARLPFPIRSVGRQHCLSPSSPSLALKAYLSPLKLLLYLGDYGNVTIQESGTPNGVLPLPAIVLPSGLTYQAVSRYQSR